MRRGPEEDDDVVSNPEGRDFSAEKGTTLLRLTSLPWVPLNPKNTYKEGLRSGGRWSEVDVGGGRSGSGCGICGM